MYYQYNTAKHCNIIIRTSVAILNHTISKVYQPTSYTNWVLKLHITLLISI